MFIFLAFTLKGLFAHSFWNNYNQGSPISDNMVQVAYDVEQFGQWKKDTCYTISATDEHLLLWTGTGFLELDKRRDHIQETVPVQTTKKLFLKEIFFTGISFDSLQKLVQGKAIIELKLQGTLPVEYLKKNSPQSGTSVSLDHAGVDVRFV